MSTKWRKIQNTQKRVNKHVHTRKLHQSTLMFSCIFLISAHFYPPLHHNGIHCYFHLHTPPPHTAGLWVLLTLLPTLLLNSKKEDKELCTRDYVGWGLWLAGMLIECLADYQKFTFRSNLANNDKWISHGLWSTVRHPNYLGEILLWSGLFVSASTTLSGCELLSVASPLFVAYLLTKVSGIPILERQNMKKWKDNPQFLAYVQRTTRLIPYLY